MTFEVNGVRESGAAQIYSPWSAGQVDALNRWQQTPTVHPFTCGNTHPGDNRLFATQQGWRCPHCDWKQDWAWEFMTVPPPRISVRATRLSGTALAIAVVLALTPILYGVVLLCR